VGRLRARGEKGWSLREACMVWRDIICSGLGLGLW